MMSEALGYNISMLGGFELRCGARAVVTNESRHSKVVRLCEYLVYNRARAVPFSELANVILGAGKGDSSDVIKNLVYRLRCLFEEAGANAGCIVYANGAYGFAPKLPCTLDIEVFNELADRLLKNKTARAEDYFAALELCSGELLPRSKNEQWVKEAAAAFEKKH